MPVTLTTTASQMFKPCFAPSEGVGLCLKSNGTEDVAVIDPFGYMCPASIPDAGGVAPTAIPSVAGAGNMTVGQYECYAYCYAASRRYPFVEGASIGGNLYPRGQPSPASAPVQVAANGACDVTIPYPDNTTRTDIDTIWIFRTLDANNSALASTQAAAGDFYYLDQIPVPPNTAGGNVVYTDLFATPTDDLAEYDNYPAPQFQFCVYIDPYWWGFGNFQVEVTASWDANGVVTFTDDGTFQFYSGRYKQPCYLKSIDADGDTTSLQRQYYAYPIGTDQRSCQLRKQLGDATNNASPAAGSGYIVFAGPSTTLYCSKYRNPFAWGVTTYVGDIRVPSQFLLKVGGGIGTGIAQIPNQPLLMLSCKGPARTYILDLRTAGTTNFAASLRLISNLLSVTSHFSQFAAVSRSHVNVMFGLGEMVLMGYDAENHAIVVSDGNTILNASDDLSATLRTLSQDPALYYMAHGLYDSNTQMNCLWLPTGALNSMDLLLMQHAPTGTWFKQFEGDVLSSCIVQSTFCSMHQLFVGTSQGLFGRGLDLTKNCNWIDSALPVTGQFGANMVLETMIEPGTPTLIGNWILVTDSTGAGDQWGQISAITEDGLTISVSVVFSPYLGWNTTWFRQPVEGDTYYIGLIEASLLRYFDMAAFSDDRSLEELWATMNNLDPNNPSFMQYFRDRVMSPMLLPGGGANLALEQVDWDDGTPSQQWFTQTPPSERAKVFGLRIVDRGYNFWQLFGWGGKFNK